MADLREEIRQAYQFVSAIPVSGDGVEIMAAAKEHLRKALELAQKKEEKHGG